MYILKISYATGEDTRYQNTSKKMCTPNSGDFCKAPRNCETQLFVLEHGTYDGYNASKILLKPVTGRRHQLRVHCYEIGHSIIGDYTYGDEIDKLAPRMYLHACRLSIQNRIENIDIQTEDPFSEQLLDGKWLTITLLKSLSDALKL